MSNTPLISLYNLSKHWGNNLPKNTPNGIVQAHKSVIVNIALQKVCPFGTEPLHESIFSRKCKELHAFPQIIELALKGTNRIQFGSLKKEVCESLCFYYVVDGRFVWMIEDQHHIFHPGGLAVFCPANVLAVKEASLISVQFRDPILN